jgi:squalene-hopene/tetraprenyl-beta-curcumene cyclase
MASLNRREWLKVAAMSPAALAVSGGVSLQLASAAPSADDVKKVIDKALDFLKTAQKDEGNFFASPQAEPGLTALIAASLARNGVPADNPVVAKAIKYLEKNVKEDGGVYIKGMSNYMTCLAIVAFKEMNTGGKYDKVLEAAGKYVKSLQFNEGLTEKDANFGGAGYDKPGGKGGPDLSNTHFMVEALLAAGVSKDDPAIKRALTYISRCQNLESEFNKLPYAAKAGADDKGGFVYNPATANDPKSDKRTEAGGLRSEGGMTYAGLKSFLYAGVGKDDDRVKAAVAWIRKNYTVSANPGMKEKDSGLFYYYHTFAKAMDALGEDPFVDAKGVKHDWRQELFDEIKGKQKENGSWANTNRAFLETEPTLATAFAILALSYCKKK